MQTDFGELALLFAVPPPKYVQSFCGCPEPLVQKVHHSGSHIMSTCLLVAVVMKLVTCSAHQHQSINSLHALP